MLHGSTSRKSGQAIIFLLVVLVIGLLAVIWNFDLHRVITAKLRMRNAGDAAALSAARWQGHALNMIGDLNLIQAAMLSQAYAEYVEELEEWEANGGAQSDEPEPEFEDFIDYPTMELLHEMRLRLEFAGPLAAFAVAQQAAFNNGAMPDPVLASNLVFLAEEIRYDIDYEPYAGAFDEYADLLEALALQGVAVSSYTPRFQRHPLTQERFYAAISQALVNWWCPMRPHRYLLENYTDYTSWPKLDTDFNLTYLFDLKLDEFEMTREYLVPGVAIPDTDDFYSELATHLESNIVIETFGDPGYVVPGIGEAVDVFWHIYDNSWDKRWPRPTYYDDETDDRGGRFPIRDNVLPLYNYMGAEAGIGMSAEVGRGILASSDNPTVDLVYQAKAKPFGFLEVEDPLFGNELYPEPPYYFGLVFPCFEEVRLVHSDIGGRVMNGVFHAHVTQHLEPYLQGGPDAADPECPYCRLLVQWEDMDHRAGLQWLERAWDSDNNPCRTITEEESPTWGMAGGGASGGS